MIPEVLGPLAERGGGPAGSATPWSAWFRRLSGARP